MSDLIKRLRDEHVSASRTEAAYYIERMEAKLAKAVGALRCYADGLRNSGLARAVLAELEGEE